MPINIEECDIEAFIVFNKWLNSALPWSRAGKYQRIKQYKANLAAGMSIITGNIFNHMNPE